MEVEVNIIKRIGASQGEIHPPTSFPKMLLRFFLD